MDWKRNSNRQPPNWQTSLAAALWSGVTTVSIVLLSRRWSGAFTESLPAWFACATAIVTASISLVALSLSASGRSLMNRGTIRRSAVSGILGLVTIVPPFALAFGLLVEPAPLAIAFLCVWFAVVLCATGWLLLNGAPGQQASKQDVIRSLESEPPIGISSEPSRFSDESTDSEKPSAVSAPELSLLDSNFLDSDCEEEPEPLNISQQITRSWLDDGGECVTGIIRVTVPAGQKQVSVHLPFCPPLSSTPAVHCEVLDDAEIRVRAAAVQVYGARLEARRSGGRSHTIQVTLGFTAVAGSQADRAA